MQRNSPPQARKFLVWRPIQGKRAWIWLAAGAKILRSAIIQIRSSQILRFEIEGGITTMFGARGDNYLDIS